MVRSDAVVTSGVVGLVRERGGDDRVGEQRLKAIAVGRLDSGAIDSFDVTWPEVGCSKIVIEVFL